MFGQLPKIGMIVPNPGQGYLTGNNPMRRVLGARPTSQFAPTYDQENHKQEIPKN